MRPCSAPSSAPSSVRNALTKHGKGSSKQSANRLLGVAAVVLALAQPAGTPARAASVETQNGCSGTTDDPCVRSGSCEIQGATWSQDVTIDRADTYDTQGWPGVCDMVHVALVQGNCEPPGGKVAVTAFLSANSFAAIDAIVGPLQCAGEAPPPPRVPTLPPAGPPALALLLAAFGARRLRRAPVDSRRGRRSRRPAGAV